MANARRAFVADEVGGLSVDALAERMKAVAASGDKPAQFLYTHFARQKMQTFDSSEAAEGLRLKLLVGEMEQALDPQAAKKRERARASLEEAQALKSYSYYRRHGAKDAAGLHKDRVYGRS
jgi:hypothetical protein